MPIQSPVKSRHFIETKTLLIKTMIYLEWSSSLAQFVVFFVFPENDSHEAGFMLVHWIYTIDTLEVCASLQKCN